MKTKQIQISVHVDGDPHYSICAYITHSLDSPFSFWEKRNGVRMSENNTIDSGHFVYSVAFQHIRVVYDLCSNQYVGQTQMPFI